LARGLLGNDPPGLLVARPLHGRPAMNDLAGDLRYAFRSLRRTPGFTAIAVLTLAFGIGANAAIFSVVDGVLLRPLAFRDPDELVRITADLTKAGRTDIGLDSPQLSDYRGRTDLFQGVAGVYPINVNLTNVDDPERIEGQLVSANFFTVLGVDAARGRVFGSSDGVPGNAPLVVISDSLWRRRFGADPSAVGRAIRLDNDLYTIIGVLPAAFRYPGATIVSEPDVFVPAGFIDTPFNAPARGQFQIFAGAIARLAPGLPFAAAEDRLRDLGATLATAYPAAYVGSRGWAPRLAPLRDDVVGSVRPALVLLMVAVGAVLLIACANVANLLLARASARHREFAVRASLGATRARLVRQVLTESVVLAVAGAAAGLGALWLVKSGIVRLVPASLPRADNIGVNDRVLGFTVLLAVTTGIVFGLWPAFKSSLASPHEALKDAGRSNTAGASSARVRNGLVAAEMAVALVLLVTAALVGRAFLAFYRVDSGFSPDRVLTAQLWMPVPNDPKTGPYFSHDQRVAFMRKSLEAIRGIPGLEAAAWTSQLPVGRGAAGVNVLVEGEAPETAATNQVEQTVVTDGYFEALQIPRLAGRLFAASDDASAPPVVVVSESFARRYFPNRVAPGRRIRIGSPSSSPPWSTIVGVVGDVHDVRPGIPPQPQLYRCLLQTSNLSMALVVRTPADPMASARLVTAAIRSTDAELPTFGVRALTDVMSASRAQRRFSLAIVGVFAIVALGLAAIGVYGVLSYLVEQRRAEIGVRMALGAAPRHVLRLVVGGGFWIVALGEAVGLVGALGAGRAVSRAIAGVAAFDPVIFGGIAVLLALVAVMACGIPAWRATRIDPLRAIRQE
jgi:predicted permease